MNPEGQLKFSGTVLLRESKKWARKDENKKVRAREKARKQLERRKM